MLKLFLSVVFFHQLSTAEYCVTNVGPTSLGFNNLGPVKLLGESKILEENHDCDKQQKGVRLILDKSADIVRGKTYTMTYESTTCPMTADRYYAHSAVWIDVNQTGTFDNSTFIVNKGFNIMEVVAHLKLPNNVKIGRTRMRVMVAVLPTADSIIDPCSSFQYGGVKDFSIDIINHSIPTRAPSKYIHPTPGTDSEGMSAGNVALIAIICLFVGCGVGFCFYRYNKESDDMKYGIQDDFATNTNEKPAYQTALQTDL